MLHYGRIIIADYIATKATFSSPLTEGLQGCFPLLIFRIGNISEVQFCGSKPSWQMKHCLTVPVEDYVRSSRANIRECGFPCLY